MLTKFQFQLPRFIWKTINFRPFLLKEKHIKTAAISLTHHCSAECTYCYAREFKKDIPNPITLSDFKAAVEWLLSQQFKLIALAGGEPTSHPEFSEICDYLHHVLQRNPSLQIVLFTRGTLLEEKTLVRIAQNKKRFISQIHFALDDLQMIETTNKLNTAARFLVQNRSSFLFRVVIPTPTLSKKDRSTIIDFTKRYTHQLKSRRLRFSFDDFAHLSETNIQKMANTATTLIAECLENNIYPSLIRFIPRCFFTDQELRTFQDFLMFSCIPDIHTPFPHFVINPDLSCIACCAAHFKIQNILDYPSIEDIQQEFQPYLQEYFTTPMLDRCHSCTELQNNRCLGICLGHRIGNKELINIA